MEVPERSEFCVMECGEEELVECQAQFYSSKQTFLNELLEMFVNSQTEGHADPRPDSNSPSELPSPPTELRNLGQRVATRKPKSLVVLDPATLNQMATSNGYKAASSSSVCNIPVSAGHNLPAVAPNFTLPPLRTVSTSAPSSSGMITLSSILASMPQPPPNCQNPQRFPAPSPQQNVSVPRTLSSILDSIPPPPPYGQHPQRLPAPSPQQHYLAPPAPYGGVRVRAPAAQVYERVRGRPPRSYGRPQVPATKSNANQTVLPFRPSYPAPAEPVSQSTTPPLPKDAPVQSTSIIDQMHRNFNNLPESPDSCQHNGTATNSTVKTPVPPPDLPLLPETRPETASDSRPRPGPASRTQRLPTSANSLKTSDTVDLTNDDQPQPTSNKTSVKEKTFPSLIVTARASLKIIPLVLINNERLILDTQIRKVMQMSPSVFTEYLMKQKLLKSEQFCQFHDAPLRLGIYTDPKRFPTSGGYTWFSDCCKSGVSVYSGSIFDKTLQPPANILKLIYHWSCNTDVPNVLKWVKVDSYIIKTYYTFFRAVCTTIVHEKYGLLGGNHKKIQVGVISIGTYPEGAGKEVKVDIMAVMDPDTNALRLKVLENFLSDSNKVYESKFRKILEVLKDWVDPKSTIITDFAVDLALCRQYGFSNLVVSGGKHSADNNCAVMDYLRAKIPLMFQNTFGLLSYTIIQQFLDELVWRETWGPYASRAYEVLVEQIGELTNLPGPDLITKLKTIAFEPTKNWKFSVWKDEAPKSVNSLKAAEQVPSKIENRAPSIVEVKSLTSSAEQVTNRVPFMDDAKRKAQNSHPSLTSSAERVPLIDDAKRKAKNSHPSLTSSAERVPLIDDAKRKAQNSHPSPTSSAERVPLIDDAKRKALDSVVRVPHGRDKNWERAAESVEGNSPDPAVIVPRDMIPLHLPRTGDMIFLEPFYYGLVDGDSTRQKRTGSFLAECVICKRDFLSASAFTNHLIHHALNSHVSLIPPDQLLNPCTLCCKTVTDVETHKKDCHPCPVYPRQSYMCKICRLDLMSEEKTVKHMTVVHQELDMPYKCDLCHFQTSIYDSAFVHFKDFHDKDSCVRCPYCFKIVRFCSKNGLEIQQNQYYFVQHIQKHSVDKLNRKCEKCLLSFTNMATLKQHQERVHKRSGKFLTNVRRLKYDFRKMLVMPFPTLPPSPPVTLHESSFHTLKGKALSSSVVVPEYYAVCACLECDGPMTQNHFSVKMTCTRCTFQSSCANSIREHSARRHHLLDNPSEGQPGRSQMIGGSVALEKPLYCSYCKFTSKNGNKMATHLVFCCDGGAVATSYKRKHEPSSSSRKVRKHF